MSLDRRSLIAGFGGAVAALSTKPLLGADVEPCKVPCTGNGAQPACNPPASPTSLVYTPPPKPGSPAGALATVRMNFVAGLTEKSSAAEADKFITLPEVKTLFKICYEDELIARVNGGFFNGAAGDDHWTVLNDHAYILGQLTGSMVRAGANQHPSVRSFLRAKAKFTEAISLARCECFIGKGAYNLPAARIAAGQTPSPTPTPTPGAAPKTHLELDKDCCLC